jgi:hypothetical protein
VCRYTTPIQPEKKVVVDGNTLLKGYSMSLPNDLRFDKISGDFTGELTSEQTFSFLFQRQIPWLILV